MVAGVLSAKADEDVMMITSKGVVIRTAVSGISKMGRATQGVMLMRMSDKEKIVSITSAAHEDEEDEILAENTSSEVLEETSNEEVTNTNASEMPFED